MGNTVARVTNVLNVEVDSRECFYLIASISRQKTPKTEHLPEWKRTLAKWYQSPDTVA